MAGRAPVLLARLYFSSSHFLWESTRKSSVDFLKECPSEGYPTVPEHCILHEDLIGRWDIRRPTIYREIEYTARPSRFSLILIVFFANREPRSLTLTHLREGPSPCLLRQNGGVLIFGWLICRKASCSDNGRSCKSYRKIMLVATYVCKTININASQK